MFPKITQLNHVALLVDHLDRSVEFYSKVLGLSQKSRPDFGDKGAWFHLAPMQELHLIERSSVPYDTREEPLTHFALVVENYEAALEHIRKLGVSVEGPKPRPDGAQQAFLRDPDGHLLELTCNVPK